MKTALILLIGFSVLLSVGVLAADYSRTYEEYYNCSVKYGPDQCHYIIAPFVGNHRSPRMMRLDLRYPDVGRAMEQGERIKELQLQNELLRRQIKEYDKEWPRQKIEEYKTDSH